MSKKRCRILSDNSTMSTRFSELARALCVDLKSAWVLVGLVPVVWMWLDGRMDGRRVARRIDGLTVGRTENGCTDESKQLVSLASGAKSRA